MIFISPVKKIIEPILIKFGRKHISRFNNVKVLGVLLDETLSWRSHLVELSRKLARSVGIFYKRGHFVPLETLKFVYYDLKPVLVSQKKVVRAMTVSDPFPHSLLLFFDLEILKLDDTYHLHVSSFVYECHNNLAPNHFSDYFTQVSDIHHHNTRSASHGAFFLKRKNTFQYGLRSVCFNGAKIWNNIPLDIRNSPSVGNFKKKIKQLFLESYNSEV